MNMHTNFLHFSLASFRPPELLPSATTILKPFPAPALELLPAVIPSELSLITFIWYLESVNAGGKPEKDRKRVFGRIAVPFKQFAPLLRRAAIGGEF
jgi:hypothetical protein